VHPGCECDRPGAAGRAAVRVPHRKNSSRRRGGGGSTGCPRRHGREGDTTCDTGIIDRHGNKETVRRREGLVKLLVRPGNR
jgi:hypothetical protein